MSEHLDLVGLLRGELSNAEAVAVGDHLDTCSACRDELAEVAVGHALLARSGLTLGPVEEETTAPPPPLILPTTPARRRPRAAALVALAAALVLAVAATATVWWRTEDDAPSGSELVAQLSPLSGAEAGDGSVEMVGHDGRTEMTVSVHDLPGATTQEFYYAWLLDPATNKMLALGLVDPDSGATFDLDDAVVASYSAVDVSLEADDGDPAHSATSLLRGSYEPSRITTAPKETP